MVKLWGGSVLWEYVVSVYFNIIGVVVIIFYVYKIGLLVMFLFGVEGVEFDLFIFLNIIVSKWFFIECIGLLWIKFVIVEEIYVWCCIY